MDVKDLKKIVALMNENGLVEIEIEEEGKRLRLRKAEAGMTPAAVPGPAAGAAPAAPHESPGVGAAPLPPDLHTITAPMVGTFYRSPSPDADPYVDVGSQVTPDKVVCVLEAMKVMNEIKAECTGEIVKVCVENGQAVEFGQPLFLVKKA